MSRKVTLTGHFTLLDGTPAVGAALIRPSRSPILDLDGKQVIAGPQQFTLDEEGRFSAALPPTDDPALGETFTYDVMVTMHHSNWQVTGLTLPSGMISVDVLDPPAGVVKEYPTRAEWGALTEAAVAEMEAALDGAETARDVSLAARDETFAARDTAVGAAGETETARTETLTARDVTLNARDVTVEARDETFIARTETTTVAGEAEEARNTAVGAAGEAESARDEAVATLAGKVTGEGMTLRHDTSVGTRVFLDHPGGSTMLYGDTGWRDISNLILPATGFTFSTMYPPTLQRTGELVTLEVNFSTTDENITQPVLTIPTGFRPAQNIDLGYVTGTTPAFAFVGRRTVYTRKSVRLNGGRRIYTWNTRNAWPDTLPGTPL